MQAPRGKVAMVAVIIAAATVLGSQLPKSVAATVKPGSGTVAARAFLDWLRKAGRDGFRRVELEQAVSKARSALASLDKTTSQEDFMEIVVPELEQSDAARALPWIYEAFQELVRTAEPASSRALSAKVIARYIESECHDRQGSSHSPTEEELEAIRDFARHTLDPLHPAYKTGSLELVNKWMPSRLPDSVSWNRIWKVLEPLLPGGTGSESSGDSP